LKSSGAATLSETLRPNRSVSGRADEIERPVRPLQGDVLPAAAFDDGAAAGGDEGIDQPLPGVRPLGWTGSGCRFDRLPGVVILEL
jgi:hypothetical protein